MHVEQPPQRTSSSHLNASRRVTSTSVDAPSQRTRSRHLHALREDTSRHVEQPPQRTSSCHLNARRAATSTCTSICHLHARLAEVAPRMCSQVPPQRTSTRHLNERRRVTSTHVEPTPPHTSRRHLKARVRAASTWVDVAASTFVEVARRRAWRCRLDVHGGGRSTCQAPRAARPAADVEQLDLQCTSCSSTCNAPRAARPQRKPTRGTSTSVDAPCSTYELSRHLHAAFEKTPQGTSNTPRLHAHGCRRDASTHVQQPPQRTFEQPPARRTSTRHV